MHPDRHAPVTDTATLALGGGGARGVAHLGAIEGILDAGFFVERVVGVSIGSLAGAMFAFNTDVAAVQKRALDYLTSDHFLSHQETLFGARPSKDPDEHTGGVFSWYTHVKKYMAANRLYHRAVSRPSLLPAGVLEDVVDNLLPDADVSEALIPLAITAVDLLSGRKVVIQRGRLRDAVRGSSSIPGIFPPVEFNGMKLADLGVFCSLPTITARELCLDPSETVIAVDVSSGVRPIERCDTALDVMMRMDEIGETLFRSRVKNEADLIIAPDVSDVEWFDFTSPAKLIDAGRSAARRRLADVQFASPEPQVEQPRKTDWRRWLGWQRS